MVQLGVAFMTVCFMFLGHYVVFVALSVIFYAKARGKLTEMKKKYFLLAGSGKLPWCFSRVGLGLPAGKIS